LWLWSNCWDIPFWHIAAFAALQREGRFSNRPFGGKRFQGIHNCGVDVTHGLALLFGIGTKALTTRRYFLVITTCCSLPFAVEPYYGMAEPAGSSGDPLAPDTHEPNVADLRAVVVLRHVPFDPLDSAHGPKCPLASRPPGRLIEATP
jgi:hypothetical protein